MTVNVLVADDEPLIRQSLRSVLAQEGFPVTVAASGGEAWRLFQTERPDVVLLDLILGDVDGLELLRRIKQEGPESKVLILSAHGTMERTVRAMKLGALEFLRKPFELEEILAAVRNAAHVSRMEGRVQYLTKYTDRDAPCIHRSPTMDAVLREVQTIAGSLLPVVLIEGEGGVGKQVIARRMHELSPRKSAPFIALRCSAMPCEWVENELFGYERGAFFGVHERKLGLVEIADGGTLFLDEIGDLNAAAQARLITFLEQGTFRRTGAIATRRARTQIIASTSRELAQQVTDNSLRADLWHRLTSVTIKVPPLRQRPEEVLPLVETFLFESNREHGRRWRGVDPAASEMLQAYAWPGNVRQLRSLISHVAFLHDDEMMRTEHLPVEFFRPSHSLAKHTAAPVSLAALRSPTLAEVERAHILRVVERCHGNRALAARQLGSSFEQLTEKLDAHLESKSR